MTREEFRVAYTKTLKKLMSYRLNEVGSTCYAEELGKLEDDYPEFAEELENE